MVVEQLTVTKLEKEVKYHHLEMVELLSHYQEMVEWVVNSFRGAEGEYLPETQLVALVETLRWDQMAVERVVALLMSNHLTEEQSEMMAKTFQVAVVESRLEAMKKSMFAPLFVEFFEISLQLRKTKPQAKKEMYFAGY